MQKKRWNIRLRSSSLVEVIVSGIIISVIFGIAVITYVNAQRTGVSLTKLTYTILMQEVYTRSVTAKDFDFREEKHGDVRVIQDVFPSNLGNQLHILHIEVRSTQGKLLAERNDLIHIGQ